MVISLTLAASCGWAVLIAPCYGQSVDASDSSASIENVQPVIPQAKKRAIQEPVFRVSKLDPKANRKSATDAAVSGYAATDAVASKPASVAGAASGLKSETGNVSAANASPANGISPTGISQNGPMRTASAANSVSRFGNGNSQSASIPNALASVTPVANRLAPPSLDSSAEPSRVSASLVSSSTPSVATPLNLAAPHPLDRAIEMAKDGLSNIQANVRDYSAIMVKRERIDGVLGCPEYMQMKIRCPRNIAGRDVPFSVYLKTLKPRKSAGREVVWVQGKNGNKLCAHETGILGMKRFYLEPTGWVAMQNSRYPIFDAGIENLIIKLIDKANFAKNAGHSVVNYRDNAEIMKRKCYLIELINEQQLEGDEFHKAHVFIDKELNLPVRYVAYDWPKKAGGKPEIIEEYTYVKISLNQDYTDIDFSPENPAYKFPRR